jgi:DNA-binding CsgD family transcriptional regulator
MTARIGEPERVSPDQGLVGGGARLVAPGLVGRADELERLAAAVAAPPALVTLEGEAGIGKTRLVSELATRPDLADRRFVLGGCRRIREPFPLGPLIEALRSLDADLVALRLSPVVGALRPLLPELAARLPPSPQPLDDRAGERHRVFRALVEVLAALGPAVLVLEDLHWADEQTVEFVGYLLADPPPQLSLLLTFRGEETDPEVRAATSKLPAAVGRLELTLGLLDAHQTGALAAEILGTGRVSEEFASYLHARTSGLPFAIEELLALLRARGSLVRRDGGWARRALDELAVPSGIRDPLLERVSRLSAAARAAAEAAAVLQVPVPLSLLTAVCRVATARALRGVEEALAAGVLVETGAVVGFRHLLAAQAVDEAMASPRRQALHARAASALEALDPVPLGQLAHHLRQAGRTHAWLTVAERAADQAVELGHDAEAARLLEEVLRHAPLDGEHRGRVAVKLGRAAMESLRSDQDLIALLSDAVEQDPPRSVRGELRFRLAVLLEVSGGDRSRQRRLYADAVEELNDRPDLKAWAMLGLALPGAPGVPLPEHLRWVHRLLEILPKVNDPAFEVFLLGKAAMVLTGVGDPAWRQLADQMVHRTGDVPKNRRAVNAYLSVGSAACFAGHRETAARLLGAGLDGVASCESRQMELRLQSAMAMLDYCRGAWDGLGDRVDVLLDELADYAPVRAEAEAIAGCLALAHGNVDEARQGLADAAQQAEAVVGGLGLLPFTASGLARLALAQGGFDEAIAAVASPVAALEAAGLWLPVARTLPVAAQALVTAGRARDARSLVNRCARELRDRDAPLASAALRHARGFLGAGAEQWPTAARHFLAAAELYDPLHCPYEAGQAREEAARCLFAAGDARAEATLLAALATYRRLGATWDYGRAAGLGRQHGVSLPARHRGGQRGYGQALSPRERQVAARAASGLTNNEIARELFVSVKTVEKHISAALRKLGLPSRKALANQLAEPPASRDGKEWGTPPHSSSHGEHAAYRDGRT